MFFLRMSPFFGSTEYLHVFQRQCVSITRAYMICPKVEWVWTDGFGLHFCDFAGKSLDVDFESVSVLDHFFGFSNFYLVLSTFLIFPPRVVSFHYGAECDIIAGWFWITKSYSQFDQWIKCEHSGQCDQCNACADPCSPLCFTTVKKTFDNVQSSIKRTQWKVVCNKKKYSFFGIHSIQFDAFDLIGF